MCIYIDLVNLADIQNLPEHGHRSTESARCTGVNKGGACGKGSACLRESRGLNKLHYLPNIWVGFSANRYHRPPIKACTSTPLYHVSPMVPLQYSPTLYVQHRCNPNTSLTEEVHAAWKWSCGSLTSTLVGLIILLIVKHSISHLNPASILTWMRKGKIHSGGSRHTHNGAMNSVCNLLSNETVIQAINHEIGSVRTYGNALVGTIGDVLAWVLAGAWEENILFRAKKD